MNTGVFDKKSLRRILHVGCGGNPLPDWMTGIETRLDINGDHKPDIIASMTDIGDIGLFDVVYCSHALEHLYAHDVNKALKEFSRVLDKEGFVLVLVPDLEGVKPTNEVLFDSFGGPVTGFDMIYGFRKMLESNPEMAHRSGFVESTLRNAMEDAGFNEITTKRLPEYNLMGIGKK